VKATFVCPSCGAGLNTEDQKRPEVCPNCTYKFGQVKSSAFRMPKTLFHQYREITRARIEAIPPMPISEDVAEVNLPDARKRYIAAQKAAVISNTLKELTEFIIGMPDAYITDTIDSLEYFVEMMAHLPAQVRNHITHKLSHMSKVANNITEGYNMGVRYGTAEAERVPSAVDSVDPGTGRLPPTFGGS
jgi:uncharacterized Zn finger protein (UPF0148 family)